MDEITYLTTCTGRWRTFEAFNDAQYVESSAYGVKMNESRWMVLEIFSTECQVDLNE